MMIDRYVKVFGVNGGIYYCEEADEPRIDAAVSRYIDSGSTIDTLIALTGLEGDCCKILASTIGSWTLSSSEGRKRTMALDGEMEAEQQRHKEELGLW